MSSRKRKVLSLKDKVSVIEKHQSGSSCRAIASVFDVGKTQVQSIIANSENIMQEWRSGARGEPAIFEGSKDRL